MREQRSALTTSLRRSLGFVGGIAVAAIVVLAAAVVRLWQWRGRGPAAIAVPNAVPTTHSSRPLTKGAERPTKGAHSSPSIPEDCTHMLASQLRAAVRRLNRVSEASSPAADATGTTDGPVAKIVASDTAALRLVNLGAMALSNAELVAIVAQAPLSVAQGVVASVGGSLKRLGAKPAAAFNTIPGFGPSRAIRLHAAIELGRRYVGESRDESQPIRSPRDVVSYIGDRMESLVVEQFHILILDSQHHLDRDVLVTSGILNSSLVHPREVFREAIAESAAALILVHNHPSGDPTPSADDRVVTEQLVAAGRLLDIPIHDHIIIGRGRYTSFAEAGLI